MPLTSQHGIRRAFLRPVWAPFRRCLPLLALLHGCPEDENEAPFADNSALLKPHDGLIDGDLLPQSGDEDGKAEDSFADNRALIQPHEGLNDGDLPPLRGVDLRINHAGLLTPLLADEEGLFAPNKEHNEALFSLPQHAALACFFWQPIDMVLLLHLCTFLVFDPGGPLTPHAPDPTPYHSTALPSVSILLPPIHADLAGLLSPIHAAYEGLLPSTYAAAAEFVLLPIELVTLLPSWQAMAAGKRQCKKAEQNFWPVETILMAECVIFMILMMMMMMMGVRPVASSTLELETEESLAETTGNLEMFVDKLPRMHVFKGYKPGPEVGTFVPANITIGMYLSYWKFHRDLPPSKVFAYGRSARQATVSGPSIEAMARVKTYVRWENHLPSKHIFSIDKTLMEAHTKFGVPTVVHLHGGVSEPASDGNADAWFTHNFREKGSTWKKSVYVYHNALETSNMWYHDHALGYTRLNLLAGLIGAYKVINPSMEDGFGLPMKKFDRQLVVMDRSFMKSGCIYINSTGNNPDIHPEWQPECFGDVVIVNGKAWPYMKVQRRKYQFRIINASNARFYGFALDDGTPFVQLGSDSFYFETPLELSHILVAPLEIADIIIDFSKVKNNSVILTNDAGVHSTFLIPLRGRRYDQWADEAHVAAEDVARSKSKILQRQIPIRLFYLKKDLLDPG